MEGSVTLEEVITVNVLKAGKESIVMVRPSTMITSYIVSFVTNRFIWHRSVYDR
jgi:hypothetical protein